LGGVWQSAAELSKALPCDAVIVLADDSGPSRRTRNTGNKMSVVLPSLAAMGGPVDKWPDIALDQRVQRNGRSCGGLAMTFECAKATICHKRRSPLDNSFEETFLWAEMIGNHRDLDADRFRNVTYRRSIIAVVSE
jgi:hypothetical protein